MMDFNQLTKLMTSEEYMTFPKWSLSGHIRDKEEWSESRKSAAFVRAESMLLNIGQGREMYAS